MPHGKLLTAITIILINTIGISGSRENEHTPFGPTLTEIEADLGLS
jgi:hypothetical protein